MGDGWIAGLMAVAGSAIIVGGGVALLLAQWLW